MPRETITPPTLEQMRRSAPWLWANVPAATAAIHTLM
jgi:hypothetical protein